MILFIYDVLCDCLEGCLTYMEGLAKAASGARQPQGQGGAAQSISPPTAEQSVAGGVESATQNQLLASQPKIPEHEDISIAETPNMPSLAEAEQASRFSIPLPFQSLLET